MELMELITTDGIYSFATALSATFNTQQAHVLLEGLSSSKKTRVGSPSRSGIPNAMHLPWEPTLVALHARQTTHCALCRRRIRAAMAINADSLIALNTVVARRFARH